MKFITDEEFKMLYAETDDKVSEEIIGRWLALKRGNAGLSRDAASEKLKIEPSVLRSIEDGTMDRLNYVFEKMMSLYEISEFEVIALQRELH